MNIYARCVTMVTAFFQVLQQCIGSTNWQVEGLNFELEGVEIKDEKAYWMVMPEQTEEVQNAIFNSVMNDEPTDFITLEVDRKWYEDYLNMPSDVDGIYGGIRGHYANFRLHLEEEDDEELFTKEERELLNLHILLCNEFMYDGYCCSAQAVEALAKRGVIKRVLMEKQRFGCRTRMFDASTLFTYKGSLYFWSHSEGVTKPSYKLVEDK